MSTVLQYMAGYWLTVSSLILVLYDWKILHRMPQGTERLEFVVLVPGMLLLIASIVIKYRRKRRNSVALRQLLPNGLPKPLTNHPPEAMSEKTSTTTLALEPARELLVSSVTENVVALQRVVQLLANRDASAADGLSRILQASEALSKSSTHGP